MFTLKPNNSKIDLSIFDLQALTNKANQNAQEIERHNLEVYRKFAFLVSDYVSQINKYMYKLGLSHFVNVNKHISTDFICKNCGLYTSYEFGHGRGSVKITFRAEQVNGKYSYDFTGGIVVHKNWKGYLQGERFDYKLESVEQILEVGAQVFQLFIIDRDVKDFNQKNILEKQLTY
jgi:hypothetical protein